MHSSLTQARHRPWALPRTPWAIAQTWNDLLFAHWPMETEELRTHIPAHLAIDTFEGQAWLGVVPFRMSGVRLRGTPALPWLSAFPELNVRTYVRAGGKAGVWFFSLDAGNALAVGVARAWFHLPYYCARMSCARRDGWTEYHSERTHQGATSGEFGGRYRPAGEVFLANTGTLDYFLTERYCLFAADPEGRVICGEIHHAPWRLQRAEAEFTRNTMAEAAALALPDTGPLLHFSRRQEVVVWSPRRIAL